MLESDVYFVSENDLDPSKLQGEGAKNLLLIARESDLANGGKEKLEAIIKAIQYDITQDCYIYTFDDKKIKSSIAPLLRSKSISDLIIFGVNPKELGFTIQAKLYTNFKFENLSFIISHKIHEMNANRQYKLALWACLKKQFLS